MTYYRLAIQDYQTASWIWKTTAVSSLQSVFQLLRSYGTLPQNAIRVFEASSKEDLIEMLRRQNANLASGSVTASQFLQETKLTVREQAQSVEEQSVSTQANQRGATVATWTKDVWERHSAKRIAQTVQHEETVATAAPLREYISTTVVPSSLGMSMLDTKRLELERGQGGDHDTPYRFTLPISVKERLAWAHLQTRVRAGELPS